MELRAAEREVDQLVALYESLRSSLPALVKAATTLTATDTTGHNDSDHGRVLAASPLSKTVTVLESTFLLLSSLEDIIPPLRVQSTPSKNSILTTLGNADSDSGGAVTTPVTAVTDAGTAVTTTASGWIQNWTQCRESLVALTTRMHRFRERTNQVDTVTGQPRYGANTLLRVLQLLQAFDELYHNVVILGRTIEPGESVGDQGQHYENEVETNGTPFASIRALATTANADANTSIHAAATLWQILHQHAAWEEQAAHRSADRQRQLGDERAAIEAAAQERQLREERALAAAAALAHERELTQRREHERAQRDAERRQRAETDRLDREWVASVLPRNPDSVRQQLATLVQSCHPNTPDQDGTTLRTALAALHTIFSQILAHPEEPNYRRIRRDHPRFLADIGRHCGGPEVLIAGGFQLGIVDDIPSFVCKEPNVETDLDGWSAWYDLLKCTVEIIEQMMMGKG